MKIDFKILEKLWDSGLYVRECVRPSDRRYKVVLSQQAAIDERIMDRLQDDEKFKQLYLKYIDNSYELASLESRSAFRQGFALAISLIAESILVQEEREKMQSIEQPNDNMETCGKLL